MYINKIDELIDKIIDDFFNNVIIKKKDFVKLLKEINFVKYQLEINKVLTAYENSINKEELGKLIPNDENIKTIIETIKRYLAYYIFLTIGFFYKGKIETFINNVIEFSKNQPSFDLRIDNFFNSESNSNIIKFNEIAKGAKMLVDADQATISHLVKKPSLKESIEFLNKIGQEIVIKNFKLDSLNKNESLQCHNILKTLIINELYFGIDKKEVFEILEAAEKEKGSYIFIDIVVPKMDYVDFTAIENALSEKDIELGLANELYDLITETENVELTTEITLDDKILTLINNNILIPISEDFLLYHKDSEKYEKEFIDSKKKKKEDTKIRYIVSKIDNITEFYSETIQNNPTTKKEVAKHFYLPLSNRKAVLINNNEELNIINKLHNQGKRSIENNEYYNDLINLRLYPYINFKEFSPDTYGFSLIMNNTNDVIRNVSFNLGKNNVQTTNELLQMRIGSQDQTINIVGFVVSTNINSIHCLKNNDIKDVRKLEYKNKQKTNSNSNGFEEILRFIKYTMFQNKQNSNRGSAVWFFNPKNDIVEIEKYEQVTKMDDSQQMKLICSRLYDRLLEMIHMKIHENIDKKKQIGFFEFKKLVEYYDNKYFKFPKESDLFNELKQYAHFEKYIKTEKKYDKKEDLFPGLYGNVIKLPDAPKLKKQKYTVISLKTIKQKEEKESEKSMATSMGAICQHLITWEKLSAIRKKNPNTFNYMLFEFINQYVVQNQETDFICKSCGIQINLKNFVIEGSYDDEGRFITFSMPMEIPLEEIPEYEKYKITIRNLDKTIDRIAGISKMPYFLGTSTSTKWRKRSIIKDTIDLLIIHNKNLKNIYKSRNEQAIKQYGISKEFTNLFFFDLENSIFIYSSKDKDYKKPIKQNNVLVYVLFLMILELNDSHIILMGSDKTCNYYFFEKFGFSLFNDLKIRKNNKGDIVPIQSYKTLCYILYFTSCMITKYNMWHTSAESETKTHKFNPLVQKIIINTIVDFLNSVLEFYGKKKVHYLYEIVSMKFFRKLNSSFANEEILKKIKKIEMKKIITQDGKKKYVITKILSIPINKPFEIGKYNGVNIFSKCNVPKQFLKTRPFDRIEYPNFNNVTNCESGTFHDWEFNKIIKCKICGKHIDDLEPNLQDTIKVKKNYKYLKLKEYAKKYCKSGQFHNFILNTEIDCNICKKCNYKDTDKLSEKELDELYINIIRMKKHINLTKYNINEKTKEKEFETRIKYINSLKSEYGKSKNHKEDYFSFVKDFMYKIESLIGKNININNKNMFLLYDAYIIDHDHNGYNLPKEIIITDKDNKILFKKDHPFFKKDVIYYTNLKVGKIDVFYDSVTMLLLGYKEINKEYQLSKNKNKYLKINYSYLNQLKFMGYSGKFINVKDDLLKFEEYFKENSEKEQVIVKELISNISRNRIENLKKVISDTQRFLYRIMYNYEDDEEDKQKETLYEDLSKIYKEKLQKINIVDKKTNTRSYEDWKAIKYNLYFHNISNKTINLNTEKEYFRAEDISYYDYHGNLILYYIVKEFSTLIDINNDKFIKANTIFFILDIIHRSHQMFNTENRITNFNIKKFVYALASKRYVYDIDEKGHGLEDETTGFYGESQIMDENEEKAFKKELDIAQEEADALDVDMELDYEIDYAPGVNMNTSWSNEE